MIYFVKKWIKARFEISCWLLWFCALHTYIVNYTISKIFSSILLVSNKYVVANTSCINCSWHYWSYIKISIHNIWEKIDTTCILNHPIKDRQLNISYSNNYNIMKKWNIIRSSFEILSLFSGYSKTFLMMNISDKYYNSQIWTFYHKLKQP